MRNRIRQNRTGTVAICLDNWSGAPVEGSGRRLPEDFALLHAIRSERRDDKKHPGGTYGRMPRHDIPYFLEFVGYEEGADEKGLDYAKKKPEIVAESMKEFSQDRYAWIVLKSKFR